MLSGASMSRMHTAICATRDLARNKHACSQGPSPWMLTRAERCLNCPQIDETAVRRMQVVAGSGVDTLPLQAARGSGE